jgi:hypothetical protein
MFGSPRGVGNKVRDEVLLKDVALFHLNMVAECCCCGHKRLIETDAVLDLIERYGKGTTMKRLAQKLKCEKCHRKEAEILFRTGDRSDDWWPRKPYNRRN